MKNVSLIKNCYGCGVCAIACPKHIITIRLNKNGFYEPMVLKNEVLCIECGLCLDVCSFNDDKICKADNKFNIESYASWSNDKMVRELCSSGGIAYELGKEAIAYGYAVCGVKYNVELERAEHYIARNEKELELSRGSKYIQSYTLPGFSALNNKSKFLVVATPCQIDSLRHYIRRFKCEDNYLLVDFYCHGVPSMLLWKKYLFTYLPSGAKPSKVSWRDKKFGWHDSWAISLEGDSYSFFSRLSKGDLFYKYFLENKCLNKPCYYNCKYKQEKSAADIRIGDLWGSKFENDQSGVSALLILSHKGKEWVNRLKTLSIKDCALSVVQEEQMVRSPFLQVGRRYVNLLLLRSALNLRQIHSVNSILDKLEFYKKRLSEIVHK